MRKGQLVSTSKIADEKMDQCAENLELEEISAELLAIQNLYALLCHQ